MIFGRAQQQRRNERILQGLPPETAFPDWECAADWMREMARYGCWISPTLDGKEVAVRRHVPMKLAQRQHYDDQTRVVPDGVMTVWWDSAVKANGFAVWMEATGGRGMHKGVACTTRPAGGRFTFTLTDFFLGI